MGVRQGTVGPAAASLLPSSPPPPARPAPRPGVGRRKYQRNSRQGPASAFPSSWRGGCRKCSGDGTSREPVPSLPPKEVVRAPIAAKAAAAAAAAATHTRPPPPRGGGGGGTDTGKRLTPAARPRPPARPPNGPRRGVVATRPVFQAALPLCLASHTTQTCRERRVEAAVAAAVTASGAPPLAHYLPHRLRRTRRRGEPLPAGAAPPHACRFVSGEVGGEVAATPPPGPADTTALAARGGWGWRVGGSPSLAITLGSAPRSRRGWLFLRPPFPLPRLVPAPTARALALPFRSRGGIGVKLAPLRGRRCPYVAATSCGRLPGAHDVLSHERVRVSVL